MSVADSQAVVPKCKLRWYQYSLRSLFALTTAVAVMLGVVMTIAPYVRKARDLGRSRACPNKVEIRTCDYYNYSPTKSLVTMLKGSARASSAANTGYKTSRDTPTPKGSQPPRAATPSGSANGSQP